MTDTNHHGHAPSEPVEADGIHYRGIVWFMAILFITTVICQVLMYGLLKYLPTMVGDDVRAPMAAPVTVPRILEGNIVMPGVDTPPPYLQTREPLGLENFRAGEEQTLTTYGWMDKNAGVTRIPIDRAKDLLIERGIPGGKPMSTTTPTPTPGTPVAPPIKKAGGGERES
jgi:hypothetical protein